MKMQMEQNKSENIGIYREIKEEERWGAALAQRITNSGLLVSRSTDTWTLYSYSILLLFLYATLPLAYYCLQSILSSLYMVYSVVSAPCSLSRGCDARRGGLV